MVSLIDYLLDRITMYRLVQWDLRILIGLAAVFGEFGLIPFGSFAILWSTLLLVVVCWISNKVFSWAFAAPANAESVYITALILALIISPVASLQFSSVMFLVWAGVLAMASKYILAINKKHIFNPAAIAVVITAYTIHQSASWWVGNAVMMPFVIIGGFLIVRKIRRWDLVLSFLIAALLTMLVFAIIKGASLPDTLNQLLLHSSLFFFAFVMLTEPLTTPPQRLQRILYGVLVGILFAPDVHVFGIYSTPELALVISNIFSYLVSPKQKLLLRLQDKIRIAPGIVDFLFTPEKQLQFLPGQYMEWTLPHPSSDFRGTRRYFTIASSPTEQTLRVGVRVYEKGSSFKKKMIAMNDQDVIVAGQLAGEFTLPKDPKQKIVLIAGGIGITPYRSMIKYLLDTKESRPIILIYANKTPAEIVYTDVFDQAQKELGIKTIYTLTDSNAVPKNWQGKVGRISKAMIKEEVPDYMDRIFYLSGPHPLVSSCEKVLRDLGVAGAHIRTDYFPGLA